MPEPKPQFTNEEQKTFERMKKLCEKRGIKSYRRMETCTMIKSHQIIEFKLKEAELKIIASANLNLRRSRGITYVASKMNNIQTEGLLLSNALQKASGEYDMILTTKAKEPIAGEIAFALFLTVLPELRVVGRSLKLFGSRPPTSIGGWKKVVDAASSSSTGSWGTLADEVLRKTNVPGINPSSRLMSFGESLDNLSKDIIESIKNPLGASADVDAETQKRLGGFNAKNQVLTEIIKAVEKKLVLARKFEPILYSFVLWYEGEDLITFLEDIFRLIGFEQDIAYDAKSFEIFADLILYDMLRAYAKRYCVAWIQMVSAGSKFEDIIGKNYDIDGFDEAQRKMIYNKFGSKVWANRTGYHSLDDSRDLIRHLGVKAVSNLNDKEVYLPNSNLRNPVF